MISDLRWLADNPGGLFVSCVQPAKVMPECFYRASKTGQWHSTAIGFLDSRLKRAGMTICYMAYTKQETTLMCGPLALLQPIFNLPNVIQNMPGLPADKVTGWPAFPATRPACGDLAMG